MYKLSDYLGQKKSLSLNYDTNMRIDIYAGENDEEHLATFVINGLDEIAASDLLKKEGVTKPRVTLSFELTRSGLLNLNKAEAKVEETYYVDVPKTKKNTTANESTSSENDADSSDQ